MANNPPFSIFKAGDLLLVEDEKPSIQSNFVKLSLSLLREAGLRQPIQFVTLDSLAMNDQTMSLEDLLAQTTQEEDVTQYLDKMKNKSLSTLIQMAYPMQVSLDQATQEQKHIISLSMGLLALKPYLIFDQPERYLSEKLKNVFFDALFFELNQHKKIAFVRTKMPQVWEPMATKKIILKGMQTSVVPLIKEKIRSKFLEINEHSNEIKEEGLIFHWPENQSKKAA